MQLIAYLQALCCSKQVTTAYSLISVDGMCFEELSKVRLMPVRSEQCRVALDTQMTQVSKHDHECEGVFLIIIVAVILEHEVD